MDSIEAAQDGEYIKMMLTEYQSLILMIPKFEKKFLAWKLDWMKLKWK